MKSVTIAKERKGKAERFGERGKPMMVGPSDLDLVQQ